MKKYKIGSLIPVITLLIITSFAHSNIFNFSFINSKGIFVIGVMVYFPLSFLIEGIVCASKQIQWIIPCAISIICVAIFLDFIITDLEDIFFLYLPYYLGFYLIGYFSTKIFIS